MKALEEIKVVDMTRFAAGPFAAMQLADMGAEVIKVEPPGKGDDMRQWGPPFIKGEGVYSMLLNKNKKSITVNTRTPEGVDIVRKLLKNADVLLENFRPGVMDKMGLPYEAVHALNPRLIYCSISGYGQKGPLWDRPGFDVIIQAESGFMDITGFNMPTRVGVAIADLVGGLYGAQGILTALIAREKTGEGQHVDIALLDGLVSLLSYQAGTYITTGESPNRKGNRHPLSTPYENFATKDGQVIIAAGNQRLWETLCNKVLIQPDLIKDPRFLTMADRNVNEPALKQIMEEITSKKTTDEWIKLLEQEGIPCGRIRKVGEVLESENTKAREMIVEVEDAARGKMKLLGIPVKLSKTHADIRLMPPLLGQHTEVVLKELGYNEQDIKELKSKGAI